MEVQHLRETRLRVVAVVSLFLIVTLSFLVQWCFRTTHVMLVVVYLPYTTPKFHSVQVQYLRKIRPTLLEVQCSFLAVP